MRQRRLRYVVKYRSIYVMMLPALAALFLFSYVPMAGIQIAFKDFQLSHTIWTAPWTGLENFKFFGDPTFWHVMGNTLAITMTRFIFGFSTPIILALLLNEVRSMWFKRLIQSVTYIPHFVSWIVVAYILESFLSPSIGIVNQLIKSFGGKPVFFMGNANAFIPIVVISAVWKEVGWNTIIYLAALSNIDPGLYEAARIDGAGRWRQTLSITVPSLLPTIGILFVLGIPSLLDGGLDQIYPLTNPANMGVSDVLQTYVLRTGLQQGYFSPAAAVGLVASVFALLLMLLSNRFVKTFGGEALW